MNMQGTFECVHQTCVVLRGVKSKMYAKPIWFLVIGLTSMFAIGQSPKPVWTGYDAWPKATAEFQDMSPAMALSCIGPKKHDMSPNPHMPKVFDVYVNEIGRKAMLRMEEGDFPVGTVIVKRKFDRSALALTPSRDAQRKLKPGSKPELLTIMHKTKNGWTYAAANGEGKPMGGDTKYCASCHQTAKNVDFVFRPYVRPFQGGSYR